jgi:RNA polymerase sigma-70 factor (ECF subfamily)
MTTTEYNDCVTNLADDLYRYASRLVNNTESGKDVVQEVYEKIWKKKSKIRVEEARNYLFKATYNTCMDHIRKIKTARNYVDQHTIERYDNTAGVRFELQDFLHQALNTLTDIQRSLILLRDYEGYSYQEIGELTGLSESQVKVYIFRGRKSLKSIIQSVNHYE